jgi:serine/threonine-protein kinase HipA
VPENEFVMMTLAKGVGIDVPEFGLIPVGSIGNLPTEFAEDKTNGYFIRRFDRGPDGERIHAEDFNQIYGQYPEKKYEQYGYTGMAKDIWALLGEKGLTEFIRWVIFNAAIGNADMHLKNWSLLYRDGRTPTLAPGYDYVSTMRYLPERGLGLPLARTKDVSRLDDELLEKASVQAGVPRGRVKDVAHETARSFIRVWSQHKAGWPIETISVAARSTSNSSLCHFSRGISSSESQSERNASPEYRGRIRAQWCIHVLFAGIERRVGAMHAMSTQTTTNYSAVTVAG